MSKNIPHKKNEPQDMVDGEDTFHNPDRLVSLTVWSEILAWVFFATGAAIVITDLIFIIQAIGKVGGELAVMPSSLPS